MLYQLIFCGQIESGIMPKYNFGVESSSVFFGFERASSQRNVRRTSVLLRVAAACICTLSCVHCRLAGCIVYRPILLIVLGCEQTLLELN